MEKLKKNVRPFMKLEVTCKAKTYEKLVESFKKENLSEPPVTMSLSAEEVEDIARDPANQFIVQQLKEVPHHTQAVERLIALSTEVSKTYPVEASFPVDSFGKPVDRFEQEMSSTLFSWKVMPYFRSKQDYRTHKKCKVHKISGPH